MFDKVNVQLFNQAKRLLKVNNVWYECMAESSRMIFRVFGTDNKIYIVKVENERNPSYRQNKQEEMISRAIRPQDAKHFVKTYKRGMVQNEQPYVSWGQTRRQVRDNVSYLVCEYVDVNKKRSFTQADRELLERLADEYGFGDVLQATTSERSYNYNVCFDHEGVMRVIDPGH